MFFLFIFEYNCQNKISHVNTNPSHRLNASQVGSTNPLYISFQKAQCDPKLLWKTTETNKPFSWFQVLFFFKGLICQIIEHFFFFFFSYTFGYFPSPSIVKPTKTWVNLSPSEKKNFFHLRCIILTSPGGLSTIPKPGFNPTFLF